MAHFPWVRGARAPGPLNAHFAVRTPCSRRAFEHTGLRDAGTAVVARPRGSGPARRRGLPAACGAPRAGGVGAAPVALRGGGGGGGADGVVHVVIAAVAEGRGH